MVSLVNNGAYLDPKLFLSDCESYFKVIINECPHAIIRFFSCLCCEFIKQSGGEEVIEAFNLTTKLSNINCTQDSSINRIFENYVAQPLMSSTISKNKETKFICDRCLNYHSSQEKLDSHIVQCVSLNKCRVNIPVPEKSFIEFTNFKNSILKQFIIYADIESILEPSASSNSVGNNSYNYQNHIPSSIGLYFKDRLRPTESYYKSMRDVDCIEWFCRELLVISNNILECIENPPYPNHCLSASEEIDFENAVRCHICLLAFTDAENYKVRDHCHSTGAFRGAVHRNCNLNYRDNYIIP